jgi:predicted amidohydrolase
MQIACVQLRAREVSEADTALEEAVEAAAEAGQDADLVVLPEATYPGYVLHEAGPYLDPGWFERGSAAFAGVALGTKTWVAVGLVRADDDAVLNSAVLLDPEGRVTSISDKVFLWHFDTGWFRPGRPGDVVSLPSGKAGMFVCADARMVEVPRRLAVEGARLLLDPTALVLSPAGTNAQIEYMLEARAWENGAYLAVANKSGVEAGIARYAGRSAIFGPAGERLAEAGQDVAEIVRADVDLASAPGPPIERAPAGYPELSMPPEALPIAEVLASPPPAAPLRVVLVPGTLPDPQRVLAELAADVAIGPKLAPADNVLSLPGGSVLRGGQELESGTIISVGEARIGVLRGDRGLVPEEVRVLMLRGASVVVWSTGQVEVPEMVTRTRADENRIFLVLMAGNGTWTVHGPTGAQIGAGPEPGMRATLVDLPLALAWQKEMAPGTDVVRGRIPSLFEPLAVSAP